MHTSSNCGIDLRGRIMRHNPWPVDKNLQYRRPEEEEITETYGISGQALKETSLAFKKDGGDISLLIDYLNRHTPSSYYRVDEALLLNEKRWYTNEFYFYFIMFTKTIMGNYNWHYSEGPGIQLSEYHKIYEIGHLCYNPFAMRRRIPTIQ